MPGPGRYPANRTLSPGRLGPSGPILPPGQEIVQIGYDQPINTMFVPPTAGALFPRDIAGAPLRVRLADVSPGNVLEVDWRMNIKAALDISYANLFYFKAVALVTFDGTEPAFPSLTTFLVINSWGSSFFDNFVSEGTIADSESISALAAVEIPGGATDAIVELLYVTTVGVDVDGVDDMEDADDGELSATLKVTEINPDVVTQLGPGKLLSSGP